jgi:hypothetical protein
LSRKISVVTSVEQDCEIFGAEVLRPNPALIISVRTDCRGLLRGYTVATRSRAG